MGYTNKDRELIIQNSIMEFKNACMLHTDKEPLKNIINSINMMENVYNMCAIWSTKGINTLKETIIEAREKYCIK